MAAAATSAGHFEHEITAVNVPQRKGEDRRIDQDEGIRRDTTPESLATLRGAFEVDGTITAGNASQLSDGAAAVLVMSAERAAAYGLDVLGELVGYGQVAGPDTSLLLQPSNAIFQAAAKADVRVSHLDNVNGGAIALGHPIGMSGTRLALSALGELRRRGGGVAAVALCGGGGQGDAAILRWL